MLCVKTFSRRSFLQSAGVAAAASLAAAEARAFAEPPNRRRTHKYEELLPEEFYEELQQAPIIYWTSGAMEEHGLQNPMGTDFYQGYEVCRRAVEISGGILFPPVPFGPAAKYSRSDLRSGTQRLFPPSLWIGRELCKQLYMEMLESMADLKFKACVAFGGHVPCSWILQELQEELGGRVGSMRFWGGGQGNLIDDLLSEEHKKNPLCGGHGTMLETSLMLATHPHLVDLPRAKRIKGHPLDSQLKANTQEKLDYIAAANAATGLRQYDLMAQRLAKTALEMLAAAAAK